MIIRDITNPKNFFVFKIKNNNKMTAIVHLQLKIKITLSFTLNTFKGQK